MKYLAQGSANSNEVFGGICLSLGSNAGTTENLARTTHFNILFNFLHVHHSQFVSLSEDTAASESVADYSITCYRNGQRAANGLAAGLVVLSNARALYAWFKIPVAVRH